MIVPGDYYVGLNACGTLVENDTPVNEYGTLTVAGDLNDQGSLALDLVFGAQGTNSSLDVEGDATIHGDLNVVSTVDSTDYLEGLGYGFTVLESTGGAITGYFDGLLPDTPASALCLKQTSRWPRASPGKPTTTIMTPS